MRLYLFIIFLSGTMWCHGQSMPMTSVIPTPYGNVRYTTYVPSPRYYYGQPNISRKYKFEIVLKNDSVFSARTKINLPEEKQQSITLKKGKAQLTLFPSETKSIARTTLDGERMVGIPADTCWLFKTFSGKINTYSFLAEPSMLYIVAIQSGEMGPIVPLTKENLLGMVGMNDAKIVRLVEKGKFIKAIDFFNKNTNGAK